MPKAPKVQINLTKGKVAHFSHAQVRPNQQSIDSGDEESHAELCDLQVFSNLEAAEVNVALNSIISSCTDPNEQDTSSQSKSWVAYLRKSVDDQRNNESLQDQKSAINLWANRLGITIHRFFQDVYSGGSDSRPGLQQAISTLTQEDARISGLVVFSLDRLSRNILHTLGTIEDICDKGKCFASVSEPDINFGPHVHLELEQRSRMFLLMRCVIAESERLNAKSRTRNYTQQRIQRGKGGSGNSPYGT
ncbi:hypothetical protein HK102_006701, partial [Quaeritorhiza haematococci]